MVSHHYEYACAGEIATLLNDNHRKCRHVVSHQYECGYVSKGSQPTLINIRSVQANGFSPVGICMYLEK